MEYVQTEGEGCSIGPRPVQVAQACAGKTIALFAVPDLLTMTTSSHSSKFDSQSCISRTVVGAMWR
jgi:peroxiredoxin